MNGQIEMTKKKKYYTVWNGREIGVFSTWEECESHVKGYPRAEYKSFPTLEEAENAFFDEYENYKNVQTNSPTLTEEELKLIGKPILETWCVDAAMSGSTKKMEYRGIDLLKREQVFHRGPYSDATNNIGEFLAIVHALSLMKAKGLSIPIYSDSKIAIGWVKRKKANSQLAATAQNAEVLDLVTRAEKWLAENTYPNKILKWETQAWGENPADFGRK